MVVRFVECNEVVWYSLYSCKLVLLHVSSASSDKRYVERCWPAGLGSEREWRNVYLTWFVLFMLFPLGSDMSLPGVQVQFVAPAGLPVLRVCGVPKTGEPHSQPLPQHQPWLW